MFPLVHHQCVGRSHPDIKSDRGVPAKRAPCRTACSCSVPRWTTRGCFSVASLRWDMTPPDLQSFFSRDPELPADRRPSRERRTKTCGPQSPSKPSSVTQRREVGPSRSQKGKVWATGASSGRCGEHGNEHSRCLGISSRIWGSVQQAAREANGTRRHPDSALPSSATHGPPRDHYRFRSYVFDEAAPTESAPETPRSAMLASGAIRRWALSFPSPSLQVSHSELSSHVLSHLSESQSSALSVCVPSYL